MSQPSTITPQGLACHILKRMDRLDPTVYARDLALLQRLLKEVAAGQDTAMGKVLIAGYEAAEQRLGEMIAEMAVPVKKRPPEEVTPPRIGMHHVGGGEGGAC